MTGDVLGETAIVLLGAVSLGHVGLLAMDRRRAHAARPGKAPAPAPKGDPAGGTTGDAVPVTLLRDPETGQFLGKQGAVA